MRSLACCLVEKHLSCTFYRRHLAQHIQEVTPCVPRHNVNKKGSESIYAQRGEVVLIVYFRSLFSMTVA
jgi:hypothetical protein